MSRINRVLVGLLALQVLAIGLGLVFCGGEGDRRAARVLLLEGIGRDAVQSIRIQDDQGHSVLVSRDEDGWMLPEQHGYPADAERVEKLLGTLLGLESSYIVSRSGAHRVELEVAADKFRRKIEIDAGDDERVLFVGGTGDTGLTHVSRSDQPAIYAVDGLSPWELPAGVRDWARKKVLEVDKQAVGAVEVHRGGRVHRLVRQGAEGWRVEPAARPVDAAKVDDLLGDLLQVAPSGVRGRWSDPGVRDAIAGHPGRVRLVLTLQKEAATPEVPPPAPIVSGPADGGVPAESGTSAAAGMDVTRKTRTLILAPGPDKDSAALLHLEGAEHVIEVDRWRVSKLLEFDLADLAPDDQRP